MTRRTSLRHTGHSVATDLRAAAAPKAKQISQSQAVAFNEAYETLKDPLTRAAYLLGLMGEKVEGEGAHTIADEALLTEQLERREALMEADNSAQVDALAKAAKVDADSALSALASNFASGDKNAAKRGYLRLKYLVKLGEEARARRARLALAR
jgi:molecular chaperone HscB